VRLFVAVIPPPEVRERALRELESLPWRGDVRWLPPENLHLTLKFLGETPEDGIPGIHGALGAACGEYPAFDLTLQGAGAFPSLDRARVVWAGAGEGSEVLEDLAGRIEDALAEVGFERDGRPFRPHLTLGKSRRGGAWLEDTERRAELGPFRFGVGSVELVRSRLSQEGAAYSTVASYPLGTGAGLDDGEERPDRHQDKEEYQDHGD